MSWLAGSALLLFQMMVNPQRVSAATAMIFHDGDMGSAAGLNALQVADVIGMDARGNPPNQNANDYSTKSLPVHEN